LSEYYQSILSSFSVSYMLSKVLHHLTLVCKLQQILWGSGTSSYRPECQPITPNLLSVLSPQLEETNTLECAAERFESS